MTDINEIVQFLINPSSENDKINKSIYFIGIGGIGMSALARYFKAKGIVVSGYDKTETSLTKQLITEGVFVHYEDNIELIDKEAQLVVYTPAMPKQHKELNYYLLNNYPVAKRSVVLGAVTNSSFNICVAGTHGKTTTSTMIAHILTHSGYGCNAFLGGIAANYNSNFWSSEKNICVVEADEYDRSFLKLNPDIAVITSMDADHLDIYGNAENVQQAFVDFAARIKVGGLLISKLGLERDRDLIVPNHIRYSIENKTADIYAQDIKIMDGSYQFNVIVKNWQLNNVILNMGGIHNIENSIAAIAVAHQLKIEDDKIKNALASFKGIKRRFEYIIKNEKQIFIDDYAHHPEELRALITGAKDLFPDKKCTVIFQPHLYSRTRDFADEFAKMFDSVLDITEDLYLLPIYPARELPIEGITSQMIADKMMNEWNVYCCTKDELLEMFKPNKKGYYCLSNAELLITAGAGDIDTLVEPIKTILKKENHKK